MRLRRDLTFIAGTLPVIAAGLIVLGPALASAKVRSPGKLGTASQGYTLDKVDDRTRMTVGCPGGKEPYGGGFLTGPAPGDDGQGAYPNSYERLGQQGGYHITAALINPSKATVVSRNLTLQVICGKKIGPIDSPHSSAQLSPGDGPKTVIAKCPKKQSLIGGGYQQTNGVSAAGVIATESHRTSARTWQVVAYDPGGFAGTAVSIGYCVRSKRSLISEVAGSVTIPSRQAGTATTAPARRGASWPSPDSARLPRARSASSGRGSTRTAAPRRPATTPARGRP